MQRLKLLKQRPRPARLLIKRPFYRAGSSAPRSGEPLRKATVHLRRRSPATGAVPGAQGYTGTSEADGSFRFEAVEPGEYNLSGERFGFLNTQYGQKYPGGAGTPLTFRAGQQITDLILKLTPQAVISGKVVDEDGDPIDNAMIQVLSQTLDARQTALHASAVEMAQTTVASFGLRTWNQANTTSRRKTGHEHAGWQ